MVQKQESSLIDNLPGMAYRCRNDSDWTMEYVSRGCYDLTGHPADALLGSRVISYGQLVYPEDRQKVWDTIQLGVDNRAPYKIEYRILTADGIGKWVWQQGMGLYSNSGELIALEGFITDITERVLAENALRDSHERFLTVINSIDSNIYVADMTTYEILLVNQRMEEDFGKDLTGRLCYQVFRSADQPCTWCTNEKLVGPDGTPTGVQLWEGYNPFSHKYYINYDRAIKWVDGRIVRIQISSDITERKQAEEKLRYLSSHDALTGLNNRFYFEEELSRLEQSRKYPVSILMADVDGVKKVNDSLGHAVGDELLKRAGAVLKVAFRAEDIVARIGGDEFAVLLPSTGLDAADAAIKRVRKNLEAHNTLHPLPLRISLGVATGKEGDSLIDVMKKADRRMYKDKSTNKK